MEELRAAINKRGNKSDADEFILVMRHHGRYGAFLLSEFCVKMWSKYGDEIFIKNAVNFYVYFAGGENPDRIFSLGMKYYLGKFDDKYPFIKNYERAYYYFMYVYDNFLSDKFPNEVSDAEYMLGEMYENGFYVDKDITEAKVWYERAYANKNIDASYKLGMCYFNTAESGDTESNKENYETALRLFYEYNSKVGDEEKDESVIDEIESVLSDKDDE